MAAAAAYLLLPATIYLPSLFSIAALHFTAAALPAALPGCTALHCTALPKIHHHQHHHHHGLL
jgi:hypothetical protein